jgi:stage III sporulation protein SpoIIIAA
MKQHQITDNIDQLLDVLPPALRDALAAIQTEEGLLEIVIDLGRVPEARYTESVVDVGSEAATQADIDYVVARVGSFGKDNRAGIERTLHRISAIRNWGRSSA